MFILLDGNLAIAVPVLLELGLAGQQLRTGIAVGYFRFFIGAARDNDFSKLRRIGLGELRRPLHP